MLERMIVHHLLQVKKVGRLLIVQAVVKMKPVKAKLQIVKVIVALVVVITMAVKQQLYRSRDVIIQKVLGIAIITKNAMVRWC